MIFPEFEITEMARSCSECTCAPGSELAQWEGELADAAAQLKQVRDNHQRQRRGFFIELIEAIMDNLDRSLVVEPSQDDSSATRWYKRTQRLQRQLLDILRRQHVEAIDLSSAPPGLVEVADVEPRDDVPDGTFVSVNWRGWLLDGELLRKPNVVVAQNANKS